MDICSKLLERVIASQVSVYFNQNNLLPPLQSAYRPWHSVTALIKIINDALLAADQGMVTLVVLLDYSAAFNTADHNIALDICLLYTSDAADE